MDHAWVEEHDAIARYVTGRLTEAEARAFEAHYVDCPTCLDGIEREEAFREGLAGPGTTAPRQGEQRARAASTAAPWPSLLAAAAALVIAAGLGVAYYQARTELAASRARATRLEQEYTQASARIDALSAAPAASPSSTPPVVVFGLESTRSDGTADGPLLAVPADTPLVVLVLDVGNAADYERFTATIRRAGQIVARAENLHAASPTSVGVTVESAALEPGSYALALEAAGSGGRLVTVGRYSFRIPSR